MPLAEEMAYWKAMTENVLEIRDLRTHFFTAAGVAKAVDGVGLDLEPGKTLALVGESGCGKTMVALSVMGLVPSPPGRIVDGSIRYGGRDLTRLSEKEMQAVRGNRISMIFQEPMSSLNPVFRIGEQIGEILRLHKGLTKKESLAAAVGLLRQVGIPSPEKRLKNYPHELSGGMRQRVVIAMALACGPDVILADEPTTALDVTIQAEILDLMGELQKKKGTSVMLITHDMGVVAETASRVAIMYSGKIVEDAGVRGLFRSPLHPYTQGLLASVPRIGPEVGDLSPITGIVPSLLDLPEGCHFHPRCPRVFDKCRKERPPMFEPEPGHKVRCWLYG